MAKKTRRGQKQCPKCKTWVKGTRAKSCPKCGYAFVAAKSNGAAPKPAPVAVEQKPASTVTLEHVKAVAQTMKDIGGFNRLSELLGTIKEVGGMKKFKDLMEAMAGPETNEVKLPF
jgi:uncharacterized Zn finger protein (UPF0148 family)